MLRKIMVTALAAVGATVAVTAYLKKREDEENRIDGDDENEVNFINILDDEDEVDGEDTVVSNFDPNMNEEDYPEEVVEISRLYSHLHPIFIQDLFEKNDDFNEEYPEDTLIEITHTASFESEEAVSLFVSIIEEGGYHYAIDGYDVRLSRKMFTENGAILSDIYNIANQVECLGGTYLGYEITK